MKKPNFNELKQIEIPRRWTENALSVPNVRRKKSLLFICKPYLIGSAAGLVLAVLVSLSLFFGLNDKAVPASNLPESTSAYDFVPISDSGEESTGKASVTSEALSPSSAEPIENTVTTPTVSKITEPTEAELTAKQPQPTVPAAPVTEPKTQAETKASQTAAPYRPTTAPATEYTTQPAWISEPISTQSTSEKRPSCTIETSIAPDLFPGKGKLYCRLTDQSGRMLGDSELFSDQHLAEYRFAAKGMFKNMYIADYYPLEKGLRVNGETYTVSFYDESGNILAQSAPTPIYGDLFFYFKGVV